jgi:bifunctional non-homologous end joining protein LigD
MKAKLVASTPAGDWTYEIKFDGFRALALRGSSEARLVSRNKNDFGGKFTEVMDSLSKLDVQDAIIDGEIVALDEKGRSSFQLLQAFELGQVRPPVFYYAFDLLRLNGMDLRDRPLEERKAKLETLLTEAPGNIRYSASLGADAEKILDQARRLGLEGLIGKRVGSHYEAGRRTGTWIKLKLEHQQEFVIGGYTEPAGSRKHFGAILVGFYEGEQLKFAGKVGTGFNEKLLQTLYGTFRKISREACPFVDLPEKRAGRYGQGVTPSEMKLCHWIEPVLVCQIKFNEWTRDYRLRQPVFLGLREDKDTKEVVREEAS